jgi:hypothetical protein
MDESALKGRLPVDVAGEAESPGIVAGRSLYRRTFRLFHDRLQAEQAVQYPTAVPQHVASGCTDLGIIILIERFLHDVDESSVTLQGGQQRNRITANRRRPG